MKRGVRCHDPWAAVLAATERRSEFGYDSYGGLTKDDERGDRPKLKPPASNNIAIFSVSHAELTIMAVIAKYVTV